MTSKISGVKFGPELALEAVGVGLLAHAAEHAEAAVEQQFCALAQPMPVDAPVMTTDLMMLKPL